jgi:hypothetical protein
VKQNLAALVAGVFFGAGLGISGMTLPDKVKNFLDVAGDWDPSLALVMVGAIAVYFVVFRLAKRRGAPLLGGAFQLPTRKDIDRRLVAGAAIFGVGWGLAGICPGPGLLNLVTAQPAALVFVGAMLAGMRLEIAALEADSASTRGGAPAGVRL